jgi:hypothetical protein
VECALADVLAHGAPSAESPPSIEEGPPKHEACDNLARLWCEFSTGRSLSS